MECIMSEIEKANKKIENGYAEMMVGLFLLRKNGMYQEAYDELGGIMNLLMEDRTYLRENHNIVG